MLNNDKVVRNEIGQLRQIVEGNGLSMLDELADLKQAMNDDGGDQTPKAAKHKFTPSISNNQAGVESLREQQLKIKELDQKVSKLISASVATFNADSYNAEVDSV